jgi:HAD superfamily hydrolase (TIGR01459 family)
MTHPIAPTAESAFVRYQEVRHRLPAATFPARSQRVASLADVADRFDAFILDAFGVLNVGLTPIPGAVDRMRDLRAMGKRLVVLTNAASDPRSAAHAKYRRLGFDFGLDEVVASRDVAVARLERIAPGARWGAIAADSDTFADIGVPVLRWSARERPQVDAFVMLSSANMDAATQDALTEELGRHPRPLVVANPDLVAPREAGLSLEPGHYAHALGDALGVAPVFFGKPFPEAYEDVLARLPGLSRDRIAMVGDTLHTDVLGGRAAGLGTVLVLDHGLFAGQDIDGYVARSGIVPDYISATT